MYRPLVLLLLFMALCFAVEFDLSVDPVNGKDVPECRYVDPINNLIKPNIPCLSIGYATDASIITKADVLILGLMSGTYSGPNNTNLRFAYQQFEISALNTTAPIIDCGGNSSAFTFDLGSAYVSNTIEGVEIRNCLGTTGAAINVHDGIAALTITNCKFTNNHALQNGGAIFSKAYDITILQSTFSNNKAEGMGGALFIQEQSARVASNRFEFNGADTGAAIYAQDLNAGITLFRNNTFKNNTAISQGGAFFADNTKSELRTYDFRDSQFENNCAVSPYANSTLVQVRCSGNCTITNQAAVVGCTDIQSNIPTPGQDGGGGKSNKDRAIIIGVVVPFSILIILSIALFLYIRKRHNAEMEKRDEYRKKILKALDNLPPEEQEAARLEAENADPNAPKCQLCQVRPISTPLPCGHEIVCGVCRTILLECPVKGCKKPTR